MIVNLIQRIFEDPKLTMGAISLISGVVSFIYKKCMANDYDVSMDVITVVLFYVLPIYSIVITIYLNWYKIIENIDNLSFKYLYLNFSFVIICITIAIAIAHARNFIMLKNKFYIFKEKNENQYKFVIKGYNNLRKNYIEVSQQYYYRHNAGFKLYNKDKSIEEEYFENKKTLYDKHDKYLDVFILERKHPSKTWFKINGWKYSILGSLPIVIFILFISSVYWIKNEHYIVFGLITIIGYTMFIQVKIANRIDKENQNFKTKYIYEKN